VTPSVRRRVAFNTAVQVAGKGAVLAIAAGSIAVLTRYLGPDDYGRFTLALMYMQLFGVLADVGLLTTVVRDVSKEPERTEELVGNALTLRLLLSLLAIALGAALSLALPYAHDVRIAIVLAGGPLLLGMLNTSLVAVFQARLRMGRAMIAEVVGRAAGFGLAVAVAALDLGFYAVMGAAAGGALVTLVVTWSLSRGLVRARFLADRAVWRPLLAASLPLGLALAINELYFRADTLVISLFRPYEDVGLYTLAYRILEFTLALGTVFLTSVFPVLSSRVAQGGPAVGRTIQSAFDFFVIVSVPLAAGGAIAAPAVIDLAGGSDFSEASTPLQVLLVAGGLAWINGVFGYALIAKERQLNALWLNVVGLCVNVGLNLALVPEYGIVAAAVITVFSELVILVGSYFLMQRHFEFFPRPGLLLPVLVAAAAMSAVLWPLRDTSFFVLLPVGTAVYAGLLLAISPSSRAALAGIRE
jgi:O-antigen/teichoic acid export membrane protein